MSPDSITEKPCIFGEGGGPKALRGCVLRQWFWPQARQMNTCVDSYCLLNDRRGDKWIVHHWIHSQRVNDVHGNDVGGAKWCRCKYPGRRRTRKGGRMMREEEALKKSICRRVLIYLCSQRQEIKRNKEIQPQITQGKKARAWEM